jgi:hypothetical protein
MHNGLESGLVDSLTGRSRSGVCFKNHPLAAQRADLLEI